VLVGASIGVEEPTAQLWDVQSGKQVRSFKSRLASSVAFSPDNKHVVFGSHRRPVELLDTQTGGVVRAFIGHTEDVRDVAFSPDGKYILTGSADKTARLWDVQTGKEVRGFMGHGDMVHTVTFSDDGRRALTASLDNTVRIWDVEKGAELRRVSGNILGVKWVEPSDGRRALTDSLDNMVRIWDVEKGAELRRVSGNTLDMIWVEPSLDGRHLFALGDDGTTMFLWSTDYEATIKSLCGRLLRDFTAEEREQYNILGEEPTCTKP
jgi:WD40 repeat protein